MYEDIHSRSLRVVVPVKVERVVYYEITLDEAHDMSLQEIQEEASELVSNYMNEKLVPTHYVKTRTKYTSTTVTPKQPFLNHGSIQ